MKKIEVEAEVMDAGVPVASASGYVAKFKKDYRLDNKKGTSEDIDDLEVTDNSDSVDILFDLKETSKNQDIDNDDATIYYHYYCKYGDKSLTDFANVAKVIKPILDKFKKPSLSEEEIIEKLRKYAYVESLLLPQKDRKKKGVPLELSKEEDTIQEVISFDLHEKKYSFLKDCLELSPEQTELCHIIDCPYLSFTKRSNLFKLGCGRKEKDCLLDDNFSEKEKKMFTLFQEQLKDDIKAKKLVILSRSLNFNEGNQEILSEVSIDHVAEQKQKKLKKPINKEKPLL